MRLEWHIETGIKKYTLKMRETTTLARPRLTTTRMSQ